MRVAIGLLAQDNPVNQKRWVKRSHPSGSREQKQEERAEAGRESGSRKQQVETEGYVCSLFPFWSQRLRSSSFFHCVIFNYLQASFHLTFSQESLILIMKFCFPDDVIIQVVFLVTVAGLRISNSSINIVSNIFKCGTDTTGVCTLLLGGTGWGII